MKKTEMILMAIIVILLIFVIPSHVKGAEEPEVFATYSGPLAQPLYKDPSIPSEELYETEYAKYIVPIVVAADEEFQQINYWVPWNINGLNWKEAALNIVERADNYIFDKYGVNFRVVGWITWQSNDNTTYYIDRIHELANQLNWNPELKGKTILAGFTGQIMVDKNGRDVAGCAFNPEFNTTKAILMHSEAYCWDDNIFHHEISHLFGADDCYSDDCVMSYKKTLVWFWSEDSWVFWVGDYVYIGYQTHEYCYTCEWQVFNGPYSIKPYANFMYGRRSPGHGTRWNGVFPL
jgi:hypothetical protein